MNDLCECDHLQVQAAVCFEDEKQSVFSVWQRDITGQILPLLCMDVQLYAADRGTVFRSGHLNRTLALASDPERSEPGILTLKILESDLRMPGSQMDLDAVIHAVPERLSLAELQACAKRVLELAAKRKEIEM